MHARIALAVLALSPSVLADVRIVAPSGATYSTIQAAITAATDGDTILVRSGSYAGFTIDHRSLSVVADAGANVHIVGTTLVANLAAGQTVVLAGLNGTGVTQNVTTLSPGTGCLVQNVAGAVRLQSCSFTGAAGRGDDSGPGATSDCCDIPGHDDGWDGVRIEGSSAGVELSGCTLRGGRAAWANINCYCGTGDHGGDALRLVGAQAAVYDCTLVGGRGGDNGDHGGMGGAALHTESGSLTCGAFASNSTLQGGPAGDGYDYVYSEGGAGGIGLVVGAGTSAQILGCPMSGGAGGLACGHLFPPGPDGQPASGAWYTFGVPPLVLSGPHVIRENADLTLHVTGTPGDSVRLLVQPSTVFSPLPSWRGVVLAPTGPTRKVLLAGDVPASGQLDFVLHLPDLGASVQARTTFLQAWRVDAGGNATLGSLLTLTTLDGAF